MTEKPKILAIESSGETCAAALAEGEKVLEESSIFGGNKHDKFLAELVARVLSDNSAKVEDLDAVAVDSGPGSFTGLRIGAAIAKALCFDEGDGRAPKLIAVPAADAFALAATNLTRIVGAKRTVVLIPSRKDVVFYKFFDADGFSQSEIDYDEISKIEALLKDDDALAGPSAERFERGIKLDFLFRQSASFIARKAADMYKKGEFVDPEKFVPFYAQEFKPKTARKEIKI